MPHAQKVWTRVRELEAIATYLRRQVAEEDAGRAAERRRITVTIEAEEYERNEGPRREIEWGKRQAAADEKRQTGEMGDWAKRFFRQEEERKMGEKRGGIMASLGGVQEERGIFHVERKEAEERQKALGEEAPAFTLRKKKRRDRKRIWQIANDTEGSAADI